MKKLRKILLLGLAVVCLPGMLMSVCAEARGGEIPVESYTYWENVGSGSRKAVFTQTTHSVKTVITAADAGVEDFNAISDICTDDKGRIYILDGGASRVVVLNSEYKAIKVIASVNGDEGYSFTGARGIYVGKDGVIYISDTDNRRVLMCDIEGNLKSMLTLPDSPLIPADFGYMPICVSVDSAGYKYVLCDGSYYGALLYTPEGDFQGFYGANKVKNTISQAFSLVMSRLFVNNKKKSASESVLPYCFVDLFIDNSDFVYTSTGFTDVNDMKGQIKKLSPGDGSNILESESVNFVDEGTNWTFNKGEMIRQDLGSVEVDDDGFIYCLETAFGRVYIYDGECRLLSAFGGGVGTGKQKGLFEKATALTLYGSDILVADSAKKTVTVFGETEFGSQLKKARKMSLSGDYAGAKELWQSVIASDSNCQLAYSGLARAYLQEGDYDSALFFAKQGYDRDTYELAFKNVRTDFISRNFWWILTLGIALIVGLLTFAVISMKRKIQIVHNERGQMLFKTLTHPFEAFGTIKEKKLGSFAIGMAMIVIYYIVTVLSDLCGGFAFSRVDTANYNSLWVLVRSAGLVLLWIICNKLVTTLMDGKGKTFDIFIVTSYSLLPAIIGHIAYIIFSNILLSDEAEFLIIFQAVMTAFTLILLMIGTIKIHDYGMGKFLGTTLLTVIAMAIVVFLIIMVFILAQQFVAFLATLFLEIV